MKCATFIMNSAVTPKIVCCNYNMLPATIAIF